MYASTLKQWRITSWKNRKRFLTNKHNFIRNQTVLSNKTTIRFKGRSEKALPCSKNPKHNSGVILPGRRVCSVSDAHLNYLIRYAARADTIYHVKYEVASDLWAMCYLRSKGRSFDDNESMKMNLTNTLWGCSELGRSCRNSIVSVITDLDET